MESIRAQPSHPFKPSIVTNLYQIFVVNLQKQLKLIPQRERYDSKHYEKKILKKEKYPLQKNVAANPAHQPPPLLYPDECRGTLQPRAKVSKALRLSVFKRL